MKYANPCNNNYRRRCIFFWENMQVLNFCEQSGVTTKATNILGEVWITYIIVLDREQAFVSKNKYVSFSELVVP